MIYLILIILVAVVMFAFLGSERRTKQTAFLLLIILFYISALSFFVLYLCKDSFHLGVFLDYFPFPRSMIVWMYALSISKDLIISLLHLCCLLFMLCNALFVFSFLPNRTRRHHRKLFIGLGLFLGIQLILYDPHIYRLAYVSLYPDYLSSVSIEGFYEVVTGCTRLLNTGILLGCVGAVVYSVFITPPIQILRRHMTVMSVSYGLLISSYLFLFNSLPKLLISYSKIARITTYQSLASRSAMEYYKYFPYVVLLFLAIFALSMFRLSTLRMQLDNHSFEVIRNIEAANLSSKLFCHFMKNEVLSISAQVEDIKATPENEKAIAQILSHCEQLYARLDGIHNSIRESAMSMRQVPVNGIVTAALGIVGDARKADKVITTLRLPREEPFVFVDPHYLEQALINIIHNAYDAMVSDTKPYKQLTVEVHPGMRWITIMITDNGCGIRQSDMVNIFTPLFSSKPMTKNWGVGLSLTHKIITALGGRINVKSEVGAGTTFEILLPAAKTH